VKMRIGYDKRCIVDTLDDAPALVVYKKSMAGLRGPNYLRAGIGRELMVADLYTEGKGWDAISMRERKISRRR